MLWPTYRAVYDATRIEFTPTLAALHYFVKLPSGKWTRTLNPPAGCVWVRGNIYHKEEV